jgi:hypothetical protein
MASILAGDHHGLTDRAADAVRTTLPPGEDFDRQWFEAEVVEPQTIRSPSPHDRCAIHLRRAAVE